MHAIVQEEGEVKKVEFEAVCHDNVYKGGGV